MDKAEVMQRVNPEFCASIRRIVEALIVRTGCSHREAVQEAASALGISESAALLAIAITNEEV
jgi:hypothetical protein